MIYTVADIKAFELKAEDQNIYFKKLLINADYSEVNLSTLSYKPLIELIKDSVFAKLLINGKKNLYFFVDPYVFKEHYLIETENGIATDLVNKRYYINEARTQTDYNQKYKNQLLELLSDCNNITIQKVNGIDFNRNVFVNLIKEYNNCNENKLSEEQTYEYKPDKLKINFGATAGVSVSNLSFSSVNPDYSQLKFKPSTTINLGLSINTIIRGTEQMFAVYNELTYLQHKYTSESYYLFYNSPTYYKKLTYAEITGSYLKLFTAFRYQKKFSNIKTFIQIGLVNGLAIKSSAVGHYERYFYDVEYETIPLLDYKKYEQSIFAGMGATYKKIGLELRYEQGNGITYYETVKTISKTFYFLAHYTF
ncbi:MAG: outer membrane beta-barrel protein [Bacteroidia bacterium]